MTNVPLAMRCCLKCGVEKPLDSFPTNKKCRGGRRSTCTVCVNARRREWYVEGGLAYKAQVAAANRRNYLLRHGLTQEDFDRLLAAQGGVCASCGTDEWGRTDNRPSVDHDHSCCPGKYSCGRCVRGLLCIRCNVFAAYLEHPDRAVVENYLQRGGVL